MHVQTLFQLTQLPPFLNLVSNWVSLQKVTHQYRSSIALRSLPRCMAVTDSSLVSAITWAYRLWYCMIVYSPKLIITTYQSAVTEQTVKTGSFYFRASFIDQSMLAVNFGNQPLKSICPCRWTDNIFYSFALFLDGVTVDFEQDSITCTLVVSVLLDVLSHKIIVVPWLLFDHDSGLQASLQKSC